MKKKTTTLKFPLIEEAMIKDGVRHEDSRGQQTYLFSDYEVPTYIDENLQHDMRYYQQTAIRYFHYSQEKTLPPQQVLFNMSTGSGKTDLMSALILYLYQEHGYQNFLFTVNTNSVLMKTRDNLVNKLSEKYLFNSKIEIDGQRIIIREVDKFKISPQKNVIYIKLSSVQKISDDLFGQEENKMSLVDYGKNPIVILADEAHHYSAMTKKRMVKKQRR